MENLDINLFTFTLDNPIIHEKIIDYLDATSISNLKLVNKFFKDICQYRPILKIYLIRGDPKYHDLLYHSMYHLETLVKKCKKVKKLSIKFKYDISENRTFIVGKHLAQLIFKNLDCKNLKTLELKCEDIIFKDEDYDEFPNEPISFIDSNIIEKISDIDTLVIDTNISTKFIKPSYFNKVKSLTIATNRDNYENCLWSIILDNFKDLKKLDISKSQIGYVNSEILNFDKLEILIMNECYFDSFPEIINELKNLKHVEVSNDHCSIDYNFTCMRNLKKLKTFLVDDFVVDFNDSDEKLTKDYLSLIISEDFLTSLYLD